MLSSFDLCNLLESQNTRITNSITLSSHIFIKSSTKLIRRISNSMFGRSTVLTSSDERIVTSSKVLYYSELILLSGV